jgi:hypothetical protein
MIDDDSNELIPFEGGDSDADANTGNNNPDDTQSVTIIQDEQGIVFLGDAGTIDLWLKDEGFDSKAFTAKAVQTISSTSKGAQAAGNAMAESGRWIKLTKESAELVAKYGKNCKKGPFQAGVVRQPNGSSNICNSPSQGSSAPPCSPASAASWHRWHWNKPSPRSPII